MLGHSRQTQAHNGPWSEH
ncbi:hypothetical protein D043_1854A, partial [Vibrio parahaemolyticus EKP-021]